MGRMQPETRSARDTKGHMTAHQWIKEFADKLGVTPPTEDDWEQILGLAAEAAHSSERMAAPVACWLAALTGRPLSEALTVAAQIGSGPASGGD
jgi:Domain of unknown function (DUF6457)